MTFWDYVKRHHVGLLALLLILTGGTAYAAKPKVHLPKNSVASKQVKNGSLQGADLKDGTLTGADVGDGTVTGADVGDGTLTGGDIADGSVGAKDLAKTAVPLTRLIQVTDPLGGGATTVFDDPAAGTITFSCGPGAIDMNVHAELPVSAQPGAVRITGVDTTDNNPVGASTTSSSIVQPTPYGGQFAGAALIPLGTVFLDAATKRVSFDWDVSGCIIRGLLVVTDKVAQPDTTTARTTAGGPTCTAVGAGRCSRR